MKEATGRLLLVQTVKATDKREGRENAEGQWKWWVRKGAGRQLVMLHPSNSTTVGGIQHSAMPRWFSSSSILLCYAKGVQYSTTLLRRWWHGLFESVAPCRIQAHKLLSTNATVFFFLNSLSSHVCRCWCTWWCHRQEVALTEEKGSKDQVNNKVHMCSTWRSSRWTLFLNSESSIGRVWSQKLSAIQYTVRCTLFYIFCDDFVFLD